MPVEVGHPWAILIVLAPCEEVISRTIICGRGRLSEYGYYSDHDMPSGHEWRVEWLEPI